jgi:biopolymer transport protein TolR
MFSAQPQFKLSALRRRNELLCRIDMWGFVSVMIVLLFMLLMHKMSYVDLPRNVVDLVAAHHSTRMPSALREDAVRVNITRDGAVFFGNSRVAKSDLPDLIRESLRQGAERRVYVSADARANYSQITAVLEEIRLTGIENVAFLTSPFQR